MAKYKHLSPKKKHHLCQYLSLRITLSQFFTKKTTFFTPAPASKALVHRNTRGLQRLGRQLLILVADQVRGGRELVAGHLLLSWGNARSQWRNPAEAGSFFTGKHGDFTTGTGSHETCWFRFFFPWELETKYLHQLWDIYSTSAREPLLVSWENHAGSSSPSGPHRRCGSWGRAHLKNGPNQQGPTVPQVHLKPIGLKWP